MNATAPVIHTIARRPRHAAIQNFPQRWTTMKTKKSWTLQKCKLLVNRPTDEVWYQEGPSKDSTNPDAIMKTNAAIVSTPKTYIHEDMYAGCRAGNSFSGGSDPKNFCLTATVHEASVESSASTAS